MSFRLGARQFFERRGAPTPPLPYDAEVEYLESTGTQYIDTGIFGRDNLDIAVTVLVRSGISYPSSTNYICGCRGVTSSSVTNITNNSSYFGCGLNSLASSTSHPVIFDEWVELEIDTTSADKKYLVNNEVFRHLTSTNNNVSTRTMYLFGFASNNGDVLGTGLLVRKFSILDTSTGQLLLDFIPVRKNGVGYMYDRVSGQLFRNAGTGNFIVGRDTNPTSARSYVNDGLVAMWDGIENAGWGVHDANATVWKDLIGSVDLMVNSNTTWFNDALGVASRLVNGVAYSSSYISSSIGTIEACFNLSSESDNGSGRGLVCNTNSRSIMGSGVSGIRSRGEASVMTQESAGRLITAFNTAVVYGQTSSADLIYFNGAAQQTVSSSGNWGLLNRIRIGGNGGSTNTAIIGKCHCVRIYSRALTAAEIAANYSIDKARFSLP